MNYANALKRSKPTNHQSRDAEAYGLGVGALWSDILDYDPKVDYKTFFDESVKTKLRLRALDHAKVLAEEPMRMAQEAERIQQVAERKEKLRSQVNRPLCKCCNAFLAHSDPPRPEVVGFCCGYCAQTNGKGHGGACQKHT
jgi:hypothetical protein